MFVAVRVSLPVFLGLFRDVRAALLHMFPRPCFGVCRGACSCWRDSVSLCQLECVCVYWHTNASSGLVVCARMLQCVRLSQRFRVSGGVCVVPDDCLCVSVSVCVAVYTGVALCEVCVELCVMCVAVRVS